MTRSGRLSSPAVILAADHRALIAMHVHADIDVMHQVASARDFQFVSALIAVDTAENDLAFAKRLRVILPPTGD